MLLAIKTHEEARDVNNLLANGDVTLGDKDTSVVDRAGKTKLEHLGLETTLKEILDRQRKDVIQLHSVLGENTGAYQTANQGVTLEKALWVLLITGKKLTSGTTNLGELETNAVNLTLVAETELTAKLQLGIKTLTLEGTLRRGISLGLVARDTRHLFLLRVVRDSLLGWQLT